MVCKIISKGVNKTAAAVFGIGNNYFCETHNNEWTGSRKSETCPQERLRLEKLKTG